MKRGTALLLLLGLWAGIAGGVFLLYALQPDCPPSQFEGGRYYSQMYEDYILGHVFADQQAGFFVDVGANHPDHFSVTRLFSDRGWRGMNIDANPQFGPIYSDRRPHDINLSVGISDTPGRLTFYKISDAPGEDRFQVAGLSTFDRAIAAEHRRNGFLIRETLVPLVRLDTLLREHHVEQIDFLNIDVEGFEKNVLRSLDFAAVAPRVVVVESTYPLTTRPVHDEWEQRLLDNDYAFALSDTVNRYYVHARDPLLQGRFEEIGYCVQQSMSARGL